MVQTQSNAPKGPPDQKISIKEKSEEKIAINEKIEEPTLTELRPLILRDYNPAITYYPLFFYSIIAALIQHFYGTVLLGTPETWLQIIWVGMLFVCTCVTIFSFPTLKVIGIFLVGVVVILVLALLYNNHVIELSLTQIAPSLAHINFGFTTEFYVAMAGIFGLILLTVLLSTRLNYIKIEENEVLIKGILGDVKRFPTLTLKYQKKIVDAFEYILLGAGQITLNFPNELPIQLNCVPRVHNKSDRLDEILDFLNTSK